MKLFTGSKVYSEHQFDKEIDFEREIVQNSKLFFGVNSIYIDAKRKIGASSLGNSIPDGFLFDLSDINAPEFYIVEVELAKHDFFRHIFPQITKFFGFYKNSKSQAELVEKIFSFISSDSDLKKELKKHLGEKEIYKFIKDTIESSQNILLILDNEKKEMPEIMETYTDTWGKTVRQILIKKFQSNKDCIYSIHPDFENIEFVELEENVLVENGDDEKEIEYTEEYHLEGVSEVIKNVFKKIKKELVKEDDTIKFNARKYYVSLHKNKNIAFFKIRKKKIALVVLNPEAETIKTLVPSVQKFWNGPSCGIWIENGDNLNEIINLLKKLIKSK